MNNIQRWYAMGEKAIKFTCTCSKTGFWTARNKELKIAFFGDLKTVNRKIKNWSNEQ